MKCLDTYALIEIANGNPKFLKYITEDFVVTNETLAEFIWVLLKGKDELTADYWYEKLGTCCKEVPLKLLVDAVKFRYKNRNKDLSFFDCVGYIFALENGFAFVTGDKEFAHMGNVEFIKS